MSIHYTDDNHLQTDERDMVIIQLENGTYVRKSDFVLGTLEGRHYKTIVLFDEYAQRLLTNDPSAWVIDNPTASEAAFIAQYVNNR